MSRFLKAFLCACLVVAPTFLTSPRDLKASTASVFYVSTSGNDSNDCLSPENACSTINAAISKAFCGDSILVTAETYSRA